MIKNIVFFTQQLESGGLEKAVITLANALSERDDYNVCLFTILHSKPLLPISERINIFFLTNRILKKENLVERYARKIIELCSVKKAIKSLHNAIIISTRNEYSVIISKYSDKSNIVIAQLHNDYSLRELKDFQNKYKNVNYFVLLNKTFKDEIEPAIRKNNCFTKVLVIPNFIERTVFNDQMKKKEDYVIAVGGFNKVKGFERLIKIWKKVSEKSNWKLLIAGDGKEFNNINCLVMKNGLENSVKLLGRISNNDVNNYMAKSKIYVLTSYSEAFPFVILEAMQNSLPVMAFDVRTGPKNMINDGDSGFLVEDGNLDSYADKLLFLINNEQVRKEMGDKAKAKSQEFLKENIIKEWFKIIDNK